MAVKKTLFTVLSSILFLIAVYNILVWLGIHYTQAVRRLPKSAEQVKVYNCNYPGDILYVVRAKMSEGAFKEYVLNMGFEPLEDENMKSKKPWITDIFGNWSDKHIEWWTPSVSTENTYYDPEHIIGSFTRLLKYEGGFAYFQESSFTGWD